MLVCSTMSTNANLSLHLGVFGSHQKSDCNVDLDDSPRHFARYCISCCRNSSHATTRGNSLPPPTPPPTPPTPPLPLLQCFNVALLFAVFWVRIVLNNQDQRHGGTIPTGWPNYITSIMTSLEIQGMNVSILFFVGMRDASGTNSGCSRRLSTLFSHESSRTGRITKPRVLMITHTSSNSRASMP